jgi:hypothetical protein
MISYQIPDPFIEFIHNKYKDSIGSAYDFFAKEWNMKCGCCEQNLYAPTKKILTKIRLYHTRNECLGGY